MDLTTSIELSAVGLYLVVLLWIGFRSAGQISSSVDFTLAGRGVPWIVVMATTAATMVGGGASVGRVAAVYEIGIAAALVTVAWHLQLIFTGYFCAPRLRGLNLITVGDYFELKFGEVGRILAVINCIIFLVPALAAQMVAMSKVTESIMQGIISYQTALIIGATVTVLYSTFGGMRAVIKTDVLQFVILVGGIGSAAAILMYNNGGFATMAQTVDIKESADVFGHHPPLVLISIFIAFLLGETLVPPYTVRCFVAKDARQAKLGVAGAGLFLLLFLPSATFVLGYSAKHDPKVQEQLTNYIDRQVKEGKTPEEAAAGAKELVVPELIRSTFRPISPILAGILIAALIAAAMSSGDSCLASLSAIVMEDIYKRHIDPNADDARLLRVAQIATLITGIAAAVTAFVMPNISELLVFVYDFWTPAMIIPFMVGLFWYSESRIIASVFSMIFGMISTAAWRFGIYPKLPEDSPWRIQAAMAGLIVALVAFVILLPLTSRITRGKLFQPRDPRPEEDRKETT